MFPPCDLHIFHEGTQVFVADWWVPSNAMERWVKKVAIESEQPVDWHYVGGLAEVLALGDIERVKAVIEDVKSELDRLRQIIYDVERLNNG